MSLELDTEHVEFYNTGRSRWPMGRRAREKDRQAAVQNAQEVVDQYSGNAHLAQKAIGMGPKGTVAQIAINRDR